MIVNTSPSWRFAHSTASKVVTSPTYELASVTQVPTLRSFALTLPDVTGFALSSPPQPTSRDRDEHHRDEDRACS